MNRRHGIGALVAAAVLEAALASAEPGNVRWQTRAEVAGYSDSDHVAVLTPSLAAGAKASSLALAVEGSYLVDIVSAASVDIVSAASPRWNEVRHAGTLVASYDPGPFGLSLSGGTSVEPDYVSLAGGISGRYAFARKNVTLSAGYTYEHDVAGRTTTPFSVYALRLDRHQLSAGLEIVLGRATTLNPTVDLSFDSGRQEKPYRWLPLFDESVVDQVPAGASVERVNQLRLPGRVAEHLPDTRQRYAASARLAHRFSASTLILWDRVYLDSWGLGATTADLRWTFDLSRRLSVWPHLRFHGQDGVSFWRHAYVGRISAAQVTVPDLRTGDRELGPLWTLTAGPGAKLDVGGTDPERASVSLEFDGSYTDFRDTLYIEHRWSALVVAGFSLRFQ
ncbi:MAG: DUF3570 domain-containing protein [Myxococcales bacterium]|nr:DUF3570 domain-containing protein [Myxococcales bacterium]